MITVQPVTLPTAQGTLVNGKLNACQVRPVYFPKHGHLSLGVMTAPNWEALTTVCTAATGFVLTCSSAADAYRDFDRQYRGFFVRYVATFDSTTCYGKNDSRNRTFEGKKYYLLKGFSPMAAPGTSNHGLAIAVDVAVWYHGTVIGITDSRCRAAWQWLQDNATHYGFTWEALPGSKNWEPWHIRYILGDTKSQGLMEWEAFLANLQTKG